ncbi:MAG: hypothetical protein HY553_12945 [Elusimicrobia bacterium]|nr:hypothetical protein [Elusimicrobiota bacterium]
MRLRSALRCLAVALSALPVACGTAQKTTMEQAISAHPTTRAAGRYGGPRRRVGVVEFENKTAYGQGRLGGAAADILTTELVKTGSFIVVERQKLDQVLAEQRKGLTGAIDDESAAKMGSVLGLNAVVVGTISNFGRETRGKEFILGNSKKQEATVTVDVRVVDAETGRVLHADSGQGSARVKTGEIMGFGSQAGFGERLEGDALRAAISRLALNIEAQVNKQPWSCRVADVEDEKIYLDAGEDSGLNIGDRLKVYRLGREIRSPTTGKVTGHTQRQLGVIEVSEFGENGTVIATLVQGKSPGKGDLAKLGR